MSLQAYQKTQRNFSNPQDNEYRIFAQVTSGLQEIDALKRTDARVIKALDDNRRLWSALASDCGLEGNQLPQALRAQIISLSLFVNRYSSQVMREGLSVEPLVDINRSVMEGLAMQRANAAQAQSQAQPGAQGPAARSGGGQVGVV